MNTNTDIDSVSSKVPTRTIQSNYETFSVRFVQTFAVELKFNFAKFILQSKTPSLWMCYTKTHWRMFAFGGLLKLLGDLATLVGPISITLIFEYIQRNLNAASSMVSMTLAPDVAATAVTTIDNSNNSLSHMHNVTQATNALLSPSSMVVASPPMINENTEIYYPTWTDFVSNGWIMALVVLCASLAQGTLSQSSTHIVNMIGIRLRGSLQSLVYRKTLLISSSCFFARTENTNGMQTGHTNDGARMHYPTDDNCTRNCDGGNDNNGKTSTDSASDGIECTQDSVAVEATPANAKDATTDSTVIDTGTIANLMSEDALNVMSFFWIAHYVWAIPLKVRTFELASN